MNAHYLILCKSLTQAQRAARVLQQSGVFASVTKAPQSANPEGCTYSVKLGEGHLETALRTLREAGIPTDRRFLLTQRGELREVKE